MSENKLTSVLHQVYKGTQDLLNLRADMDEASTVAIIRENITFRSANAWTLAFAIFIASIGLNTNSAAVIIGAMLISPLMGPIIGVGLALGISDLDLLKKSALNLFYAVLISIVASTCYFFISPLSEVQSELLARTQPTFYDVLIAVFGGAAGIVALSRKQRGNAVPGVAIATALMPPLCTAGFGLAHWELNYFVGAFYLFIINSVFICLSTYAFVRYTKFKRSTSAEDLQNLKINRYLAITALVVIIPSLFLAYHLHRKTLFISRANEFIKNEIRFDHTFVVGKDIQFDWKTSKITVSLIGDTVSDPDIEKTKNRAASYSISPESIEIRQASLDENLEKKMEERFKTETTLAESYKVQLTQKDLELQKYHAAESLSLAVSEELRTVFPQVDEALVFDRKVADSEKKRIVLVRWKQTPGAGTRARSSRFLQQRLSMESDAVVHTRNL